MKLHGIKSASEVLASQKANVLFYKRATFYGHKHDGEVESQGMAYGFRRGTMPVPVPRDFVNALLDKGWVGKEVLLSLRPHHTQSDIAEAFLEMNDRADDAFARHGITARHEFVKILLIASYGAFEGDLRVIDPEFGIENLSHYLLRETDFADSRVYNPNLGGLERLEKILSSERFDLVGVCPIVVENDVEIMALVSRLNPDALKVAGGPLFFASPPEDFLRSFPIDVVVRGPGEEALARIAQTLFRKEPISDLKGLWSYENGRITHTGDLKLLAEAALENHPEDVPVRIEDVYHGVTYLKARKKKSTVQGDHIGSKPIPIQITDHCRGRCLFCETPRNTMRMGKEGRIAAARAAVERIKKELKEDTSEGHEPHDAVQILDNNFTTHRKVVEEFCHEVIRQGIQGIKKSCKGRVDEFCVSRESPVPDREFIGLMARAGFKRIYFGNESFVQGALDSMDKGITVEQNENVLQAVIDAGIIPGMNLILFGGLHDRPADALHTVRRALHFIEKGATANVVGRMYASERALRKHPERIGFETLDRPGMRAPYKMLSMVYTNAELEAFADKAAAECESILKFIGYRYPFETFSTHVKALALFWAVAHVSGEDELAEKAEWLIDDHMCAQSRNVHPYPKIPSVLQRKMRYAFIDGIYGEAIQAYNEHLEELVGANPGRFAVSGVEPGDLKMDPLKPVIDIGSLANDLSVVIGKMERDLGRPLRIRMAGYPATGKTMLRNQLIARGMDLKLVHLDRYRQVQGSQMMLGIAQVETSYDMPGIERGLEETSGERLLYEGTWVLAPEFNFGKRWDLSLAFDFPRQVWTPSLWFRQILFRGKEIDALLPSKEQLEVYDAAYARHIVDRLSDADLVIGPGGEFRSNGHVSYLLEEAGIRRFKTSFFMDQLRHFR